MQKERGDTRLFDIHASGTGNKRPNRQNSHNEKDRTHKGHERQKRQEGHCKGGNKEGEGRKERNL